MEPTVPRKRNESRTLTQAELVELARERFGDDPLAYAFVCPSCQDVATVGEFKELGEPDAAGQMCIGRLCGALTGPPTNDGGRAQAVRDCRDRPVFVEMPIVVLA